VSSKDDPEVVKKVHQILESYQEQVRISPEEHFKPAPRRNSIPKDSAGPAAATPNGKGKKKGGGGAASVVPSMATSPAGMSSSAASEASERAMSVASDSNLSLDGFHQASCPSPTPSIGSTLDGSALERALELRQMQRTVGQSVSRSTSPQMTVSTRFNHQLAMIKKRSIISVIKEVFHSISIIERIYIKNTLKNK
jgi:hypothetical protein